jgi:hypothetical protein
MHVEVSGASSCSSAILTHPELRNECSARSTNGFMELEDRLATYRVRPFIYVLRQREIVGQVLFHHRDILQLAPGEQLRLLL